MGTMNAAAWLFVPGREADRDEAEEILIEAHQFTAVAVVADGGVVILKTPSGCIFIEVVPGNDKLMMVDFYKNGACGIEKISTWYNENTLMALGELIRNSPEKKVPAEEIIGN